MHIRPEWLQRADLLLATLLFITGCDSGIAVDPLPADPAANMVGDPVAGAAQAKMATRTVTGDVTLEGTITTFDLEGQARYSGINTDGAAPLFERAQLRLVGAVGTTTTIPDTILWFLSYREDDADGTVVYDARGQYRSDEQQGRLRGTLTGLFSRVPPSKFVFDGKFDFQVALPLG